MTPVWRVTRCATTVLVAVVATAGCGVAGDGPLKLGGEESIGCASAQPGTSVAFGQPVYNSGSKTAILEQVDLVDPVGTDLEAIYVVPVVDQTGTGIFRVGRDGGPPGWPAREEVRGAEIDPGVTADIVVVVSRNSPELASIADIIVAYTVDGRRFQTSGTYAYQIEEVCE